MRLSLRLAIPCGVCGSDDGHEPGCKLMAIQELHRRNSYIACPKCHEEAVGINKGDLYECRACHVQYSTSTLVQDTENPERVILLDYKNDKAIDVIVLKAKGNGEFPIDAAIVELRQQIAEIHPEHNEDDEIPGGDE